MRIADINLSSDGSYTYSASSTSSQTMAKESHEAICDCIRHFRHLLQVSGGAGLLVSDAKDGMTLYISAGLEQAIKDLQHRIQVEAESVEAASSPRPARRKPAVSVVLPSAAPFRPALPASGGGSTVGSSRMAAGKRVGVSLSDHDGSAKGVVNKRVMVTRMKMSLGLDAVVKMMKRKGKRRTRRVKRGRRRSKSR